MARFDTAPWRTVGEFSAAKRAARDVAESGGCLRTGGRVDALLFRLPSGARVRSRDPTRA